jgi:multiple sugar transport system ATP-binding protein
MAKVELRNVCKTYEKKVEIVKNISLDINDKEFIVLVGPSGCGKSTILRMIAGLEEITAGEIYIGDRVVNNVHPKDRDIAMVFQNYALYPHMNVYDNMAFGLKMRKFQKDEIDKRVREAAESLNLTEYLERKPRQLSGGQRQRVALGRAIVRDPQVFLMDEPLSNLDAKLRVQMRFEIKKLHDRLQTTFIYVTHDQVEAMTMGDKIVVLNGGVIQQADTPENIYNYPENKFVAGFIGSPAMNFVEVLISDDKSIKLDSYTIYPDENLGRIIENNNLSGKKVTIGIRPEHFYLNNEGIKAVPELVEMLGSEKLVHFMLDNHKLVAKLSSDSHAESGKEISLIPDLSRILLFDRESGQRYK